MARRMVNGNMRATPARAVQAHGSTGILPVRVLLFSLLSILISLAPAVRAADDFALQYHQQIEPLLKQVCYDCHGGGKKKGGLQLDQYKTDAEVLAGREMWTKALRNVRAGVMPPPGETAPTEAQ